MMHFLRPYFLLLLLPSLWICWRVWTVRPAHSRWQSVCDNHLMPYLNIDDGEAGKNWLVFWVVVALLVTIIALAGPSWRKRDLPVYSSHVPVVVLMDLSGAMLAQDITPSRLQRAKYKIIDLLKLRKGGQMALLAFTREPFVVTPLTDDLVTIINLLNELEPTIMPVQGYDLTKALVQAEQLITRSGADGAELLVVTSSGASQAAVAKSRELAGRGIYVSVLGVGTEAGGPLILADGGLVKNDSGNVVSVKLPVAQLRRLAKAGGGRFSQVVAGNQDVESLVPILQRSGVSLVTKNSAMLWQDDGHWLILLLLPLILVAFRRGALS